MVKHARHSTEARAPACSDNSFLVQENKVISNNVSQEQDTRIVVLRAAHDNEKERRQTFLSTSIRHDGDRADEIA